VADKIVPWTKRSDAEIPLQVKDSMYVRFKAVDDSVTGPIAGNSFVDCGQSVGHLLTCGLGSRSSGVTHDDQPQTGRL